MRALLIAAAAALLAACAGADVPDVDSGPKTDAFVNESGVTCFARCTLGAQQCATTATPGASGFQLCVKHANGCDDWGQVQACPSDQVCSGGVCRHNCVDQCTLGAVQCSGAGTVACEKQVTGCTDWGNVVPCQGGTICSGAQCVSNCSDQCTLNAKQCSGSGVQSCETKPTGCTDWGNAIACKSGEVCSGGQCVSTCTNQCTLGDTLCSGSGVKSCETKPSGCTDWGNAIACKSGEVCSGGKCVQSCTNQCTFGTSRCSGSGVQGCVQLPSGCTDWGSIAPCKTGETCQSGTCVPTAGCTKGARRCSGTTLEECDGQSWFTVQICPQSCVSAACSQTVQCTPGARRCGGSNVEECNPSGTAWLFVRSCALGCQNGLCVGGCTPGDKRCNGSVAEVCKSDGSGYSVDKSCAATFCVGGACAETSLLLDNTTVTMDGEHVYAGDVILKNNSQITVGASGWLRIRAKNITIDATSSINAPAVGDSSAGAGSGGTHSCRNSYCSSSISGTVTSAGGYGTAGSSGSKSIYNCYRYSYNRYCTISASGGAAHGAALGAISMGSPGGGCSTPNGGGMIDLQAESKLSMSGTLKADGGTAAQGGGGSCAAGSGGGIRLVADDLTVNGVLSAVGSGGGGKGRIKLLYGALDAINATTNGVVEQSLIPPLDVRSSTHPDQTLVYNDDFEHINVAWSKPFSNVAGYFYKVSSALPNAASQVPGAQDTWIASESLGLTRADVQPGNNYVNVVGVAPNATLGTVEAAFGITINDKPPTVTSSSHPSSSTWYTSSTVIFGWTDPVAAANVKAYYYVLDQYADTVPTKGAHKLPGTDKALLVANQPAGAIRFLHLIGEDSAGYLTKKAAHFRVQIGPEPGKGGVSGAIREAGSTPPLLLDGVEVTLNRGVLSTTSASGGQYFFSNTVWAGTWELRARKAGYQDYVKTITVTAGQNTPLDIQMTKAP